MPTALPTVAPSSSPLPSVLKKGLVAYYPFKGNAFDASGNSYHGEVVNAVLGTDRFGISDSAYVFNGASSYIYTDGTPFNFVDQMAVSFWVKPAAAQNAWSSILDKTHHVTTPSPGGHVGGWYFLQAASSTNGYFFSYITPLANPATSQAPELTLSPNVWTHVVVNKKRTEIVYYANNQKIFTSPVSSDPNILADGDAAFIIGAEATAASRHPNSNQVADFFSGAIDDIFIFNRTLSDVEISLLFGLYAPTALPTMAPTALPTKTPTVTPSVACPTDQPTSQPTRQPTSQPTGQPTSQPIGRPSRQPFSNPTGQPTGQPFGHPSSAPTTQPTFRLGPASLSDGLMAFFPFDGNADDNSGNTNHGKMKGAASFTTDRYGNPSNALNLDGTSGYVEVPGAGVDFDGSMSISFWMKSPLQNSTYVLDKSAFTPESSSHCSYSVASPQLKIQFVYFSPGNVVSASDLVYIPVSTWTHVVIAKTVANMEVYLNGNLVANRISQNPTICKNGNKPLVIGGFNALGTTPASGVSSFFRGQLDDIMIYNRQLTVSEIIALASFDNPTSQPSSQPVLNPTAQPSKQPVSFPTSAPTVQPNARPTAQPSRQPTSRPSKQPTSSPTSRPSRQPSSQPTKQPIARPTGQPTSFPTVIITSALKTGLVAFYPFDGNANDNSGHGNNGFMSNGVKLVPDRFGNARCAVDFDGSTGYIEIPGQLFNLQNMTISFWLKPSNPFFSGGTVMDKSCFSEMDNNLFAGFHFEMSSGTVPEIRFSFASQNGTLVEGGNHTVQRNEWNHIAITKDGKKIIFYFNGIETNVKMADQKGVASNDDFPLFFGGMNGHGSSPLQFVQNFYNGSLDDVFIYSRALTDLEISKLYIFDSPTSQPTGQPSKQPTSQPSTQPTWRVLPSLKTGLSAFYPFDGNANDNSGNENHGIIKNAKLTTDRYGYPNSAYSFNGQTSYIYMKGNPFNFKRQMSLSFWVKPTTIQPLYSTIMDKAHYLNTSAFLGGWLLLQNGASTNNYLFGITSSPSKHFDTISTNFHVTPDIWSHVAITRTLKQTFLYINAVLVAVKNSSAEIVPTVDTVPLVLGASSTGMFEVPGLHSLNYFFNGSLDDIFIFNRTLGEDEVLSLYMFDVPTSQPSGQPSYRPSGQPTRQPYACPSSQPSGQPSSQPTIRLNSNLRDGLVAFYPFDGNANDNSGNGIHGTVFGGVTLTTDRFGTPKSAFNFLTGSGGHINFKSELFCFGDNMTVSFWARPSGSQSTGSTIFDKAYQKSPSIFFRGFSLQRKTNNIVDFSFSYTPIMMNTTILGKPINIPFGSQWTHVAIVKSKNFFRYYKNGELTSNEILSDAPFGCTVDSPLVIGAQNNDNSGDRLSDFYLGSLDDFLFYNRPLADYEIRQLFKFDVPTSQPSSQPSLQPSSQPSIFLSPAKLKNGLVAYYPFNGNVNDDGTMNKQNKGAVRGGVKSVADRFGKERSAYSFDGQTGYVEIPGGSFNFKYNMSVSFWVKSTAKQASASTIFDKSSRLLWGAGDLYVGGFALQSLPQTSSNFQFAYCAKVLTWVSVSNVTIPPNVWTHVVVSKNSNFTSVYVNSILVSTVLKTGGKILANGELPLLIGATNSGHTIPASTVNRFFNGSLDDIYFFNRPLGLDEVNLLYSMDFPTSQPTSQPFAKPSGLPSSLPSGKPTVVPSSYPTSKPTSKPSVNMDFALENGLVAFYPFDGNADDASGHGNDGSVFNAVLITDRHGKQSNAYFFDGNSSYIEVPGEQFNFFSNLTISLWIKPVANQHVPPSILEKGFVGTNFSRSPDSGFMISCSLLPICRFRAYTDDESPLLGAFGFSTAEVWSHLAIVKNGHSVRTYVNGTLRRPLFFPASAMTGSGSLPLIFGASNAGGTIPASNLSSFFEGALDDIAFYDRPLSSSEIYYLTHGNAERAIESEYTLPEFMKEGLLAYYPFDGNVEDESRSNNGGFPYEVGFTENRFSRRHRAAHFNGSSSFALLPVGSAALSDDLTIAFWIMPELTRSGIEIKSAINSVILDGYNWLIEVEEGVLNFKSYWASSQIFSVDVSTPLEMNTWTHVVICRKSNDLKIVLNDEEPVTGVSLVQLRDNLDVPLIVGGHFAGDISSNYEIRDMIGNLDGYFKGELDELFLFRTALSDQEILWLYNQQLTRVPTNIPTVTPSFSPSEEPTMKPTPSAMPTYVPSETPTEIPTVLPTAIPSDRPSEMPSAVPTFAPTEFPTFTPSVDPTEVPTYAPTLEPTVNPTEIPSRLPTFIPSAVPSENPSELPTERPSFLPTFLPSNLPSSVPSVLPSVVPSSFPTSYPSYCPTAQPSSRPSSSPSSYFAPTNIPTSSAPSIHSVSPTFKPTFVPTTIIPTEIPSMKPTVVPTSDPTFTPSVIPSVGPTEVPSFGPSTIPSFVPSVLPTVIPSESPSMNPTWTPTDLPSYDPSMKPSLSPSFEPTFAPSVIPSVAPTFAPSQTPTNIPSTIPTVTPTVSPTATPSTVAALNEFITSVSRSQNQIIIHFSKSMNIYGGIFPKDNSEASSVSMSAVIHQNIKDVTTGNQTTVSFINLIPAYEYSLFFMPRPASADFTPQTTLLLHSRINVSTLCCRMIEIKPQSNTIMEGNSYLNFIGVQTYGVPVKGLKLSLQLQRDQLGSFDSLLVPSSIMYPVRSSSQTSLVVQSDPVSLNALGAGNYTLTAILSGNEISNYLVQFSGGRTSFPLKVSEREAPLPAPNLFSAGFLNDGVSMEVSFGAASNRGGKSINVQFSCNELLSFPCANSSTCQWMDDFAISASIYTSNECVAPGEFVSLSNSARIKALCPANHPCSNYNQWPVSSTANQVKISSPVVPSLPNVVLSLPSVVSSCSNILFDLTSSTGNYGRSWKNISVEVQTTPAVSTVALINAINQRYATYPIQLTPPFTILSSFLKENVEYTFHVRMCNYLGFCGVDNRGLKVISTIVPVVTIIGVNPTYITRSLPLSLISNVQIRSCNGTAVNPNELTYSWTVSNSSKAVLTTLSSQSKDATRFLLPPYSSLQANQFYYVSLKVTYLTNVATSTLEVIVNRGKLVAVLGGGVQQSMRVSESKFVDASASYDEDIPFSTGLNAGLAFSWSCMQVQPVVNSSCSGLFTNVNAFRATTTTVNTPSFIIQAKSGAPNTVAQVTVVVADPKTQRTSSSSIQINILPSLYPTITLYSATTKVNPSQSLKLLGTINLPSKMKGNATWINKNLDLTKVTSTPITQLFSGDSLSVSIYFSLNANALIAGSTYSFALKCQLSNGIQSTNTISVLVNSPPTPGTFQLVPTKGEEAHTPFSFQCNNWVDADLPLSYQFGYLSFSGSSNLLTRTLSQLPYTSTVLPAGLKSNNEMITCTADIYDSLHANSSVTNKVQVTASITANLSMLVNTNLNSRTIVSVDDLVRGTTVASSLLNKANCSHAPNCTALHRLPCSTTSHSCGSCLPSYFSTSSGDGNDQCYQQLPPITVLPKLCNFNCSSHGQCVYFSSVTTKRIDHCYQGDLSCYSSCDCSSGYRLSTFCEISDEQMQERIKLRDQVVEGILTYASQQDNSEQVVSGWMNSIVEVSHVPNQLSENSVVLLLELSNHALVTVSSQGYSAIATLSSFLDGMDSLSTTLPKFNGTIRRSFQHRRRLETTDSSNQDITASSIHNSLKDYTSLVLKDMVPGEDPVTNIKNNFRMHVENVLLDQSQTTGVLQHANSQRMTIDLEQTGVSSCTSTASITLPTTSLESTLNQQSTQFTVPACPTSANQTSISVAAVSLSSNLYFHSGFTSNAVSLYFAGSPCSSRNSDGTTNQNCKTQFTTASNNVDTGVLIASVNKSIECTSNDRSSHTVSCPNGKYYTLPCLGVAQTIVFHCPSVTRSPVCAGLLGTQAADSGCTVVSYGLNNITCSCPITPPTPAAAPTTASSASPSLEVSYVSLITTTEKTFASTIVSAQDLNASTLKKSWQAIITIGALIAGIFMTMLFSHYADKKARGKISTEEKLLSQAKVHSSLYQQKFILNRHKENETESKTMIEIAEEALPKILSSQSLSKRIWNEEKRFHKYLGIFCHFSLQFPRILRVVSLSTNVIIMLFIQSLTYNFTHGNDGSCEKLHTAKNCLAPKSDYGTGTSKCYWQSTSSAATNTTATTTTLETGLCHFIQPENNLEVILFVAIFSALISTPLAILVDYLINYVLSAPDTNSKVGSSSKGDADDESLSPSNKFRAVMPAKNIQNDDFETTTSRSGKRGGTRFTSLLVDMRKTLKRARKVPLEYDLQIEKDYENILQDLIQYRHGLRDEVQKAEIDSKFVK
jgi:hypothetical protein